MSWSDSEDYSESDTECYLECASSDMDESGEWSDEDLSDAEAMEVSDDSSVESDESSTKPPRKRRRMADTAETLPTQASSTTSTTSLRKALGLGKE